MGGLSLLLMLAVAGVTYGWQSDDRGGVEYIIQVPPEQLNEIERLGEISSVIDPAVQGHVSRVIIRVGTGDLPRETPVELRRRVPAVNESAGGASDQSPVPIPEMRQGNLAIPIPSLETSSSSASRQAEALKPQTGDATGLSLPSSLGGAVGNGLRGGVDRAGRDTAPRTPLVAPPPTRSPNPSRAPAFTTGSPRNDLAQPRLGGPSTDPTNTRDQTWQNLTAGAPQSAGPSTEPIGASGLGSFGSPAAAASTAPAPSSRRGAGGLGAGSTFGQTPKGISLPASGAGLETARPVGGTGRGTLAQTGLASPTANVPNANNPNATSAIFSQQEQTRRDQQSPFGTGSLAGTGAATTGTGRGFSFPNSSTTPTAAPTTSAFGTSTGGIGTSGAPRGDAGPDPRLTAAQIAAGAWSIDSFNRILDRRGQPMSATIASAAPSPSVTQPRPPASTGMPPEFPSRGSSWGNGTLATTGSNTSTWGSAPREPASAADLGYPTNRPVSSQPPLVNYQQRPRQNAETRPTVAASRPDPPSIASSRPPTTAAIAPRQVAAQPLFNGLLLISFVANIYLIFWLKNLRVQFRDLVAAKRMAGSGGSPG